MKFIGASPQDVEIKNIGARASNISFEVTNGEIMIPQPRKSTTIEPGATHKFEIRNASSQPNTNSLDFAVKIKFHDDIEQCYFQILEKKNRTYEPLTFPPEEC